jgi:hypothetical protein
MFRISLALCVAVAMMALTSAKGGVDFTSERFFRFGMEQSAAEAVMQDEKNWKIMYRVDTTQTCSIACVYQGLVFYQVNFYQGRCYLMEKRAEVPLEQVDPTFQYYLDKLGKTDEMTSSSDEKLVFSRWTAKDRETSLTAAARDTGIYMMTYEEQDPIAAQDAEHAMDEELGNASSNPQDVDPITGKPRLKPQDDGTQPPGDDTKDSGKKDDAKKDEGKKDDGKKDDGKKDDGLGDDGHDMR